MHSAEAKRRERLHAVSHIRPALTSLVARQ